MYPFETFYRIEINTNEILYSPPHPPLPLKGGGLGRGDLTSFIAFVLGGGTSEVFLFNHFEVVGLK